MNPNMQLCLVYLIPPNKDYITLLHQSGKFLRIPRSHAPYVSRNDIVEITQLRNRYRLRILTDDDEFFTMNHPDRKQLVAYGYFDTNRTI